MSFKKVFHPWVFMPGRDLSIELSTMVLARRICSGPKLVVTPCRFSYIGQALLGLTQVDNCEHQVGSYKAHIKTSNHKIIQKIWCQIA